MEEPIDRRKFGRAAALAAGGATVCGWFAAAFALDDLGRTRQDPDREPDAAALARLAVLRAARERAQRRGRPLVVFVVPPNRPAVSRRGELLRAFLDRGGRDVILDLALGEPVCATAAELREVFGGSRVDREVLIVVVEPGEPARMTPVAPDFAAEPERAGFESHDAYLQAAREHREASTRALGRACREVLARDAAQLAARADAVRSHLDAGERRRIEEFIAGARAELEPRLVLDAAAVLRMAAAAPRRPGDRERLEAAVERAARGILVAGSIPGSQSAQRGGCGFSVEGERDGGLAIACGMAAVPPLSRRFLRLYTEK